ncbi:hypothetical protein [Pedobacter sp. JY14-1]|uniref:hypothetical protein n=1 Tax=Pedobacter sp. JY14-1 TaxID=3034151 RepID=UPI0023E26006|nr:hypothetical protein [Pedobacter sp. JY14-1]
MYNRNLKYKWDNENVMDYAVKTARQEGLERGIEQGERRKAVEMALKLKDKGLIPDEIADLTGLTPEEVKAL